jgi:hypothetical protein
MSRIMKRKLIRVNGSEMGGRGGRDGRPVIFVTDQNFPAVLPSAGGRCLAIMRMEQATMDDLADMVIKLAKTVTIPKHGVCCWFAESSVKGRYPRVRHLVRERQAAALGGVQGGKGGPILPPPSWRMQRSGIDPEHS